MFATDHLQIPQGGSFLIRPAALEETFIPELLNEEQQMVRQMTTDFIKQEIDPVKLKIEKQEPELAPTLLEKMGELGLLGAHMPEEYGGLALDTHTNTVISDVMGPAGSFSVGFAAHTGIGMLPLLYFGTDAQKEKYLPGLVSGTLKASYCLTEPGSGSDALNAKTRATLTEDGQHYVINGQKMWITNAGFADVFIVFAKIDGTKFTAFIVEKGTEGLTLGAEEDKMGIKGSSTRQVFFENMKVPVGNVLGEIGKGHLIAFNVLNIGRYKLGVLCMGASKAILSMAAQYANERHQFGVPIGQFGAIRHKIAEMAIRIFAAESATYRTSHFMQERKEFAESEGKTYAEAMLDAAEEYAIECSILKVLGSEVLDYVVDENVQIHGGIGFSEEFPAARAYRDSRINRIFEGTNEINRLLMVDMLFKRMMKGEIDLLTPIFAAQDEWMGNGTPEILDGAYAAERRAVNHYKKLIHLLLGAMMTKQADGKLNLKEEQELLMSISDLLTEVFAVESFLLRVMKLAELETAQPKSVYDAMLQVFFYEANTHIATFATDAFAAFMSEDELMMHLTGVHKWTAYAPVNTKAKRREVSDAVLKANGWCF